MSLSHIHYTEPHTVFQSGIPRQSLTSAVAERLRERIIRGLLPEGAQLRQDAIAKEFHVSRIPVREALRQLEAEGLILIVQHRGAVVRELSPNDVEELFTIRALLEPELLKLSIPHLTEKDFTQADKILRTYIRELKRADHVGAWGQLNWQFHSVLYSKANRPYFMSVLRNINNNGERYTRLQLFLTRGMERANREHRKLLDLSRQRDVPAACELLRHHILDAARSLKELLQQRREPSQSAEAEKQRRTRAAQA